MEIIFLIDIVEVLETTIEATIFFTIPMAQEGNAFIAITCY